MLQGGVSSSDRVRKEIPGRGTNRGKRSGQEQSDALEKLDMEQEEQVLISTGPRHMGVRQYGGMGTVANWKVLAGSGGNRTQLYAIVVKESWPNIPRSSRF